MIPYVLGALGALVSLFVYALCRIAGLADDATARAVAAEAAAAREEDA